MHIAHVGVSFQAETMDGPTRAVSAYAREQAALGHRVTMVRLSPDGASERRTLADGLDEVVLPVARLTLVLGRRADDFFATNALAADVYHFHSSSARHWAAGRLLPVPYVISPHGAFLAPNLAQRRVWTGTFRALIGRAHLRRAAFVHAITPAEETSIRAYAGAGVRVEVVPNALQLSTPPTTEERTETRRRLHLDDDELAVLFLGRLDVVNKGLDSLVEGFARARRRSGRRLRLLLVGPPWGDRDVAALVPADVRGAVTIAPPALGEEKRALLAAADVFATLSRWDVMPTAVLDALALGLPIVVSEETGFGDFVRHAAGCLVTHDPDLVADALCSFDDPRSLLASRPVRVQAAVKQFHPRLIAERFVALYAEAIERRGP